MSAPRSFPRTNLLINKTSVAHWLIECACGATATSPATGAWGSNPMSAMRHWRAAGWTVGNKKHHDFCAVCSHQPKEKPMQLSPSARLAAASAIPPGDEESVEAFIAQAGTPRTMGRDEKRLVYGKIDEVYLGEGNGYSPGWDDERVAKALSYPRAWVTTVREEMFGPAVAVKQADDFLEEVAAAQKRHAGFQAELAKANKAWEELGTRFGALVLSAARESDLIEDLMAKGRAISKIAGVK